jgi:membrane-associated phospholipid phosphatase
MRRHLLFLILFTAAGFSQDTTVAEKDYVNIIYDDAMLYFKNCAAFFTSPIRADATDWMYAAGITGATILLLKYDDELLDYFGRDAWKPMNGDLWDIPTVYGVVEYSNVLSGGVYLAGLFLDDEKTKVTGRLLMETITVSGVTALALRYITGRRRPPYSPDDHMDFRWFETTEEFQSFPSGHAVVGVALSVILAERIDTWWSRSFFYGLAGLSSFVRLYNNQHWFTDVLTGSLLGAGAGIFMLNREHNRTAGINGNLSIIPGFNGINLIYSF